MPVHLTTATDLRAHLAALGISSGDKLVVHSRLLSFGRVDGGVSAVFAALQSAVGPQGSIVVPTYTLEPTVAYDPKSTPSQGVGVLSEYVRQQPAAVRSRCPLHNHAGIGSAADVLAAVSGRVSIGAGSDFAALKDAGFKLILLGAPASEGATFLHHLEAVAELPYRTWLTLARDVVGDDEQVRVVDVRYYGRADSRWHEDFDPAMERLVDAGIARKVACPYGNSYAADLGQIASDLLPRLRQEPYLLVRRVEG